MTEITQFDDDSIFEIAKSVQRLRAQVENLQRQLRRIPTQVPTHEIRTGKTKARSNETYPASGCVLPVQFVDLEFAETIGTCVDLVSHLWPKKFINARTYHGGYIKEDTDVLIVKVAAKSGRRWILIPKRPGGCDVIRFKILSANPAASTASVAIQSIPPGCSLAEVPGQTSTGVVNVCDALGCLLSNEPSADLVGRDGWAHYQLPVVVNACQTDPNNLVEHWEIVTLCCPDCTPEPSSSSPSSGGEPSAMITGSGPGPIPGQFLL